MDLHGAVRTGCMMRRGISRLVPDGGACRHCGLGDVVEFLWCRRVEWLNDGGRISGVDSRAWIRCSTGRRREVGLMRTTWCQRSCRRCVRVEREQGEVRGARWTRSRAARLIAQLVLLARFALSRALSACAADSHIESHGETTTERYAAQIRWRYSQQALFPRKQRRLESFAASTSDAPQTGTPEPKDGSPRSRQPPQRRDRDPPPQRQRDSRCRTPRRREPALRGVDEDRDRQRAVAASSSTWLPQS